MTLWYLIRSLGFVALLALTASTMLGALATDGPTTPDGIDRRLLRQLTHRSLGILGLVALVLHIVVAVVDAYVDVPLSAAILPFGSGYRPVAMAVGVLGLYALIVTTLSGALRASMTSSTTAIRGWRALHASAYLGWVLSMAHGLFSGSDTATWWGIATYALCGIGVIAALVARLLVRPRRVLDVRGHLRLDPGAIR